MEDRCHIDRQTKEEEENILSGCDESKVCDLKQPSRDLFAKNSPPVVFIFSEEKVICIIMPYNILGDLQIEETTTVSIVTQPRHIVRQGIERDVKESTSLHIQIKMRPNIKSALGLKSFTVAHPRSLGAYGTKG